MLAGKLPWGPSPLFALNRRASRAAHSTNPSRRGRSRRLPLWRPLPTHVGGLPYATKRSASRRWPLPRARELLSRLPMRSSSGQSVPSARTAGADVPAGRHQRATSRRGAPCGATRPQRRKQPTVVRMSMEIVRRGERIQATAPRRPPGASRRGTPCAATRPQRRKQTDGGPDVDGNRSPGRTNTGDSSTPAAGNEATPHPVRGDTAAASEATDGGPDVDGNRSPGRTNTGDSPTPAAGNEATPHPVRGDTAVASEATDGSPHIDGFGVSI